MLDDLSVEVVHSIKDGVDEGAPTTPTFSAHGPRRGHSERSEFLLGVWHHGQGFLSHDAQELSGARSAAVSDERFNPYGIARLFQLPGQPLDPGSGSALTRCRYVDVTRDLTST